MSIIEAAALGRPAIASDNEYSRESMTDGATGLIVPPGDARALAAAINKLLNNPSLCHDYGEAGRRFVAERFSKERSVSKMLQIYGVPDGERLSGDEKHD
jgi:glycosyltransferase involved in cell wall biosynthesis